jgi:hypothetical protein
VAVVRKQVSEGLAAADEEIQYVAMLAASELAENVVKYGEESSAPDSGIELELSSDRLRVRSTNRVARAERAAEVFSIVHDIETAPDPVELYVEQMKATLQHPERPSTRLGFYRMAAEGQLRLSQTYVDGCLTITAERILA